jgi:hypothetical protein
MTGVQKSGKNKQILSRLERELANFRNESIAIPAMYLKAFPKRNAQEIRQMLINARAADVENYKHIIEWYGEHPE